MGACEGNSWVEGWKDDGWKLTNSWGYRRTDGRTDRQADRQTDRHFSICFFVQLESIAKELTYALPVLRKPHLHFIVILQTGGR